jgi:hypothetical protein
MSNMKKEYQLKYPLIKMFSGLLLLLITLTSCPAPPEYPPIPRIDFVSMSRDTVIQSLDSNVITISFEDGDGDIGSDDVENLFLTDITLVNRVQKFKIPRISQQGIGNGISGKIDIVIEPGSMCCDSTKFSCVPETGAPMETIIYNIYLEDRAGNASNVLQLPPLRLICDQ